MCRAINDNQEGLYRASPNISKWQRTEARYTVASLILHSRASGSVPRARTLIGRWRENMKAIGTLFTAHTESVETAATFKRITAKEAGLKETWFRDAIYDNPELVIRPLSQRWCCGRD
jgi:hypothetical protein